MTTAKLLACVALAALLSGCCGIGMPSEEKVRRWVAPLTPGTPADQAFNLLQKKGFDPFRDERRILGQRSTECFYFTDYVKVWIHLDGEQRVRTVEVFKVRISA